MIMQHVEGQNKGKIILSALRHVDGVKRPGH